MEPVNCFDYLSLTVIDLIFLPAQNFSHFSSSFFSFLCFYFHHCITFTFYCFIVLLFASLFSVFNFLPHFIIFQVSNFIFLWQILITFVGENILCFTWNVYISLSYQQQNCCFEIFLQVIHIF